MQISVERLAGVTVEITVTVPAERVGEAVADAYSKATSRLRVPGFRPGKAPRQIVDARIGAEAILDDARGYLIEDTYPEALDSERLRPIDQADFGQLADLVEGEAFSYTATVEIRPEFELTSDDPITVTVPSAKATEEEIDSQIEFTRERFATLEPVERGVEDGDFVLLSFVGKVDGEDYEDNVVDKYLYETGRGVMPPEFDEALTGAKSGESRRAEFVIPGTTSNPEYAGRTASFEIEVHEVKAKILPEPDDAFASEVGGYESLDELRGDIRRRIEESRAVGQPHEIERAARAVLASRVEGKVPEAMVSYRANSLTEEFFGQLEERQISIEDYIQGTGVGIEQIHADIAVRAESLLREELALEALCRRQGLEVTEEEVEKEVADLAGSEAGAADRMMERLRGTGMLPILREQIAHRKAIRWLMENVEVVETERTPEADAGDGPDAPEGDDEDAGA